MLHTVYAVGVFDLFHMGHVEFLRRARAAGGPGARLVVGVVSDADAAWKRRPVMSAAERAEMVRACGGADEVIEGCPLVVTGEFLDARGITLVVHGDDDRQETFFRVPIDRGIMRYVPYTRGVSTSASLAPLAARAGSGSACGSPCGPPCGPPGGPPCGPLGGG